MPDLKIIIFSANAYNCAGATIASVISRSVASAVGKPL